MPVAGAASSQYLGTGWLLPAGAGPSLSSIGSDPKRQALVFGNATTIRATHQFVMPEDWDGGAPALTLFLSSSATGTIRMGTRLRCGYVGENFQSAFAWGTEPVVWGDALSYDSANSLATIMIPVTSSTNCAGGRLAYIEVVRDDSDSHTGNVALYDASLRVLTNLL
jgi:hypothetical protein